MMKGKVVGWAVMASAIICSMLYVGKFIALLGSFSL